MSLLLSYRRFVFCCGLAAGLTLAGGLTSTQGVEVSWTGGFSSNDRWHTARNWSSQRVPGADDQVKITQGLSTITLTGAAGYAQTLDISSGSVSSNGFGLGRAIEIEGTTLHIGSRLTLAGVGSSTQFGAVSLEDQNAALIGGAGAVAQIGLDGWGQALLTEGSRMRFEGGITLGVKAGSVGQLVVYGAEGQHGVVEAGFIGLGATTSKWSELLVDGGMLRATRDEARFLRDFRAGTFNVDTDGIWIDSAGFQIGIDETTLLAGRGALHKTGAGTLTLSGSGRLAGGIRIHEGRVEMTARGFEGVGYERLSVGVASGDAGELWISGSGGVRYYWVGIGEEAGSRGEVLVSGSTARLDITAQGAAGYLYVGQWGEGHLTLADGAEVAGVELVSIADEAGSLGTIDFGSADLAAPTKGGTLQTGRISFGNGTALMRFNQTDALAIGSRLFGNGNVIQRGAGQTTMTGVWREGIRLTVENGAFYTSRADGTGEIWGQTLVTGGEVGGNGRYNDLTFQGGTLAPWNDGYLLIHELNWEGGEIRLTLGPDTLDTTRLMVFDFNLHTDELLWAFENGGWEVGATYQLMTGGDNIALERHAFTNGLGFDGTFSFENGTLFFTVTAVPEPGVTLLVAGVGILWGWHRWRRGV